nr:LamB/YcsF family protein [Lysinibacillus boronitolerans]
MPIDINCDLGESYNAFITGKDEALLDYVTSINIACGYHAGHHSIMHQIVRSAINKNVHIGAHPAIQIERDLVAAIWNVAQLKFTI